MGPNGCLDESAVVAFLEGSLAAPERSAVESHLGTCPSCMDLMTWAAAEHAHRSRAPGNEGRPYIGRLPPGARIDRYQILAAVGRGGMGEVYAAYHPDLDRRIALKVVNESGAGAPERRARLLREARAIARLSHPNVITVHDAGTVDDRVYIAMEFVEGKTVDEWRRAQPRSWREVLDVFVAAGRGLAAAHAAGVVHRDFKPHNVMIGRDGSVRVMDFGLARLAEEPLDPPDVGNAVDARPVPATVTKTGALVGTLAYMAPEQFRGELLDARADQFSFCVALHEALYGSRPLLSHLPASTASTEPSGSDADASQSSRRSGAPAWLRSVVVRGMSEDRSRRFPSMDALLAAVSRGHTRVRVRAAVLGVGAVLLLLSLGGWRLAAGRHPSCTVPRDRLAAVWLPGDEANPRRQAIHGAFVASGRPTAETVWQRVAKALDDYTTQWSAMHVQTCEATHVHGEQSGEVLDLRMGCLADTLDGVRALTEVLSRADGAMISQAVTAASSLAPLNRCADVSTLRSTVAPPRDEKTARTVDSLRRSLRDAMALEEVGNSLAAMKAAQVILPQAEATGFKPLIADVLVLLGNIQIDSAPADAEVSLEKALYAAEAARDDLTAAKAAVCLVAATGYRQERARETDRWASLAGAILDRLAFPQPRLRAWLLQNQAGILLTSRKFESARALLEQSLALKESALGANHPDVGRTVSTLAWALNELGRPEEALRLENRAIDIFTHLDPDGVQVAYALGNRGETLNILGQYRAAEESLVAALRVLRAQLGPSNFNVATVLQALGESKLGQGDADAAIRQFDEALKIRVGSRESNALEVADTQFALARALAAAGQDPTRARTLAAAAQAAYASHDAPKKSDEVVAWLEAHRGARR